MQPEHEAEARARFAAERRDLETVTATWLDAVPYRAAGRPLEVEIITEEFGHICPMTGLPDYGELRIRYQPRGHIVELKSLKYYLLQYRQVGVFYEHVVHRILDDLVAALDPVWLEIRYETRPRGGIRTRVEVRWPFPEDEGA